MNILIILALLLPRSEAAQESDEGEARRLLLKVEVLQYLQYCTGTILQIIAGFWIS